MNMYMQVGNLKEEAGSWIVRSRKLEARSESQKTEVRNRNSEVESENSYFLFF